MEELVFQHPGKVCFQGGEGERGGLACGKEKGVMECGPLDVGEGDQDPSRLGWQE